MDNCVVCGTRLDESNECWECDLTEPLLERIQQLTEAGEEMANNLAFLANHLQGRIGEGAQAEMLRLAKDWYELVPQKGSLANEPDSEE